MIHTIKTTSTLKTVKQEFEAKAKEMGFHILNSYSFKERVYNNSLPIDKVITVFELYNPPGSQQALHLAEISVYLPCRVAIYVEDRYTVLSTMGFENLLKSVQIDDGFKTHMSIIFENIKRVMHSWDRDTKAYKVRQKADLYMINPIIRGSHKM